LPKSSESRNARKKVLVQERKGWLRTSKKKKRSTHRVRKKEIASKVGGKKGKGTKRGERQSRVAKRGSEAHRGHTQEGGTSFGEKRSRCRERRRGENQQLKTADVNRWIEDGERSKLHKQRIKRNLLSQAPGGCGLRFILEGQRLTQEKERQLERKKT